MKKILIITMLYLGTTSYILAETKCKDLPGFKTVGDESKEYLKCLSDKLINKDKINTDSRLTDWIKKKMNK